MAAIKLIPFDVWTSQITQASIPANQNALRSEVLARNALGITNPQPASPQENDLHILGNAPTGAQWSTFTPGNLTIFKSGTWLEFESYEGLIKASGDTVYVFNGTEYVEVTSGGGGGSTTFITLTDAPSTYSGEAGKVPVVKETEDGLEFQDFPSPFIPENFTQLEDTPSTYAGQGGKLLGVNSGEQFLEFVDVPGIGAQEFTQLDDTPNSYIGAEGKFVKVRDDGLGLLFGDFVNPFSTFRALEDTPDSYADQEGKMLVVAPNQTGIEFVDPPAPGVDEFTQLTDTPTTFTGSAGKVLGVNVTESALEFIDLPETGVDQFIELTDTPSTYTGQAGKVPVVKVSEDGLEFIEIPGGGGGVDQFIELTDTPSTYTGQAGRFVKIKDDETGVEFVESNPTGATEFVQLDDVQIQKVAPGTNPETLVGMNADGIFVNKPENYKVFDLSYIINKGDFGYNNALVIVKGGDALNKNSQKITITDAQFNLYDDTVNKFYYDPITGAVNRVEDPQEIPLDSVALYTVTVNGIGRVTSIVDQRLKDLTDSTALKTNLWELKSVNGLEFVLSGGYTRDFNNPVVEIELDDSQLFLQDNATNYIELVSYSNNLNITSDGFTLSDSYCLPLYKIETQNGEVTKVTDCRQLINRNQVMLMGYDQDELWYPMAAPRLTDAPYYRSSMDAGKVMTLDAQGYFVVRGSRGSVFDIKSIEVLNDGSEDKSYVGFWGGTVITPDNTKNDVVINGVYQIEKSLTNYFWYQYAGNFIMNNTTGFPVDESTYYPLYEITCNDNGYIDIQNDHLYIKDVRPVKLG